MRTQTITGPCEQLGLCSQGPKEQHGEEEGEGSNARYSRLESPGPRCEQGSHWTVGEVTDHSPVSLEDRLFAKSSHMESLGNERLSLACCHEAGLILEGGRKVYSLLGELSRGRSDHTPSGDSSLELQWPWSLLPLDPQGPSTNLWADPTCQLGHLSPSQNHIRCLLCLEVFGNLLCMPNKANDRLAAGPSVSC